MRFRAPAATDGPRLPPRGYLGPSFAEHPQPQRGCARHRWPWRKPGWGGTKAELRRARFRRCVLFTLSGVKFTHRGSGLRYDRQLFFINSGETRALSMLPNLGHGLCLITQDYVNMKTTWGHWGPG